MILKKGTEASLSLCPLSLSKVVPSLYHR
uniref:Uncharacterized protein n=1 Tax=Rhizophora mucronata TaxID=61149 RepID=A0A2P2PCV5_RHIMU